MDFKEIQELVKLLSKSDIAELKLESENFKITLRTKAYVEAQNGGDRVVYSTAPAPAMIAASPVAAPSAVAEAPKVAEAATPPPAADTNLITIKSPMIGTFYRSPSPDKPPFVKVGDTISKGDKICIIEAMKLFNEIESEVSGRIVKVLVDDMSPVEYDQAIFLVEP